MPPPPPDDPDVLLATRRAVPHLTLTIVDRHSETSFAFPGTAHKSKTSKNRRLFSPEILGAGFQSQPSYTGTTRAAHLLSANLLMESKGLPLISKAYKEDAV